MMKTFKRNVISLDSGDKVEINFAGVSVLLEAITDLPNGFIEITVPHGMVASDLDRPEQSQDEDDAEDATILCLTQEGDELEGPFRFITFTGERPLSYV